VNAWATGALRGADTVPAGGVPLLVLAIGGYQQHEGDEAIAAVTAGSAMALAYDARRVTRDVDAMFVPHGIVLDEARAVAEELGLPRWWHTSRPACTSPAGTTRASDGSSIIPDCVRRTALPAVSSAVRALVRRASTGASAPGPGSRRPPTDGWRRRARAKRRGAGRASQRRPERGRRAR
jgi:hypothetical protein